MAKFKHAALSSEKEAEAQALAERIRELADDEILQMARLLVSKPEREIFGDTVRYDVRGARAAGLRPVHFDPFDLCPDRTDHAHIHRLTDL